MIQEKPDEVDPKQLDKRAVVERVRKFVRDQMSDGASAPDLSFALAYIATDLGLAISADPLRVFPVVLEGIAQASLAHSEATPAPVEERKADLGSIPASSAIH